MVFTARDSRKNPHVFRERRGTRATGDVDERASRASSTKEKTRRRRENGEGRERETRQMRDEGVGGGEAREKSIARLTGAQASYVLRLRYGIVGRLGRL